MCTNIIRALRWQMMLQSLEYKPKFINLLGTIMINYLANLGIPRSGELIRAGILSSHEDIPVEKIFGTIVTDRLFDVIMLAIVIGLAMIAGGPLFTEYITSNTHISFSLNSSQIIAISIMIGLFLLIVVWCTNKYWYMLKEKQWIQRILDMAKGFLQGILSVKKVSNLPLFILYTIGIWFLYYCMMYFSFFTFDATSHLGYTAALIVFVFGSLGILIPTPGGMGSYHFLVAEALTLYGVSAGDGFSFANIVFFSVSVFVSVFFGLLFLIFLPMYNKKISI